MYIGFNVYVFRIGYFKLLDMKFTILDLKIMYNIEFGFSVYRVWF